MKKERTMLASQGLPKAHMIQNYSQGNWTPFPRSGELWLRKRNRRNLRSLLRPWWWGRIRVRWYSWPKLKAYFWEISTITWGATFTRMRILRRLVQLSLFSRIMSRIRRKILTKRYLSVRKRAKSINHLKRIRIRKKKRKANMTLFSLKDPQTSKTPSDVKLAQETKERTPASRRKH